MTSLFAVNYAFSLDFPFIHLAVSDINRNFAAKEDFLEGFRGLIIVHGFRNSMILQHKFNIKIKRK